MFNCKALVLLTKKEKFHTKRSTGYAVGAPSNVKTAFWVLPRLKRPSKIWCLYDYNQPPEFSSGLTARMKIYMKRITLAKVVTFILSQKVHDVKEFSRNNSMRL